MRKLLPIAALLLLLLANWPAHAQTLNSADFRIEWSVVNRFPLFKSDAFFQLHENAWRRYLIQLSDQAGSDQEQRDLAQRTSVLGSEHVLNDRRIGSSNALREKFDWRGWAARSDAKLCYDSKSRKHEACGSVSEFLNPVSHRIAIWLEPAASIPVPEGKVCEWRIGDRLVARAYCTERVSGEDIVLPYPDGADISVNVVGEAPVITSAKATEILIVGLGDSFASGEGNPNTPVEFGNKRRYQNFYPARKQADVGGSAQWTDELCHRSMYGQQFRAALQTAVENPKLVVRFLDYSCSGASIDDGILGPQTYVEYVTDSRNQTGASRSLEGGWKDSQIYRLLDELCNKEPEQEGRFWKCPRNDFRRKIDFVFLSVGGNDIGFSNVVAWATLRSGVSASIASFFGATVSADEFSARIRDLVPPTYGRLARALEESLPLYSADDGIFDPSRVILSAYPDMVTDEHGQVCKGSGGDDVPEDNSPANQSLDVFSSWLVASSSRLKSVRARAGDLYDRMRVLAEDHGWTFAGSVYSDKMFDGHGFCARNEARLSDPAEVLMMPCWGRAERDTQTCQPSFSGKEAGWRPYDPVTENFPYVRRQRWVRTFNDAYLVVNQKVIDRSGRVDDKASAAIFSETIGALHPTAEGHAAMADSLLISLRPMIESLLGNAN